MLICRYVTYMLRTVCDLLVDRNLQLLYHERGQRFFSFVDDRSSHKIPSGPSSMGRWRTIATGGASCLILVLAALAAYEGWYISFLVNPLVGSLSVLDKQKVRKDKERK